MLSNDSQRLSKCFLEMRFVLGLIHFLQELQVSLLLYNDNLGPLGVVLSLLLLILVNAIAPEKRTAC